VMDALNGPHGPNAATIILVNLNGMGSESALLS
jgi:hypothetical protein